MKVMRAFLGWLSCLTGAHDWTCAAHEGIAPTPKQLESVAGFYEYATMYCARCGHVSDLSVGGKVKTPRPWPAPPTKKESP